VDVASFHLQFHIAMYKGQPCYNMAAKVIKGFVEFFKKNTAIIAWDLGNECNVMGYNVTRSDAYAWSCSITNAIKAVDNSRPVYSECMGLPLKVHGQLLTKGKYVMY